MLLDLYGEDESSFKKITSYFGLLFSLGALLGLFLEDWFFKLIGKMRLVLLMEVLHITIALLYLIESKLLLIILRAVTGVVGGLSLGVTPCVLRDLFPANKSGLGCTLAYLIMVSFVLIASLQNQIFGGRKGLRDNWRLIYWWPAIFGGIRLILLAIFLGKYETPGYWLETCKCDDPVLKARLNSTHKIIYTEKDAEKLTKIKLHLKDKEVLAHDEDHSFRGLFKKKYRVRFLLGCLLNFFRQLGGINILIFFSTQLFDDISGNGALITLLIGIANVTGAVISVFTASLKRRLTYGVCLIIHSLSIFTVAIGIWIDSGNLAAIAVFIYMVAFAIGNGSMLSIYISELVPHSGIGIAMGSQWISSAIVGIGTVPLRDQIGAEAIFCICGGCILI